jgi:hypothetical protein
VLHHKTPDQRLQPTQHFVENFRLMSPPIFKVLGSMCDLATVRGLMAFDRGVQSQYLMVRAEDDACAVRFVARFSDCSFRAERSFRNRMSRRAHWHDHG